MNSLPYSLLLIGTLTLGACSPNTPEQALQLRIENSIDLIESEKYEDLLLNYYQPGLVDDLKSNHNIKKLAKYYGEAPQTNNLLNGLRLAYELEPTFNTSKTKATFSHQDLKIDMIWQQIDGVWYLMK